MRTRSLGQEVSFTQVLPLLGVQVHSTVLPAIVNCPCCQGNRLHIYRDIIEQQDWFYCHGCRRYGDMIELAAAAWKLDLWATLAKLREADLRLSETLDAQDYLRHHVRFRQRITKFYRETQAHASEQGLLTRELFRTFRLPLINGEWYIRGGQFVGIASRETIQKQILVADRGVSTNRAARTRQKLKLSQQAMRGAGWDHALIVPYYSLPGRICGLLLIGQNPQGQPETAYFPTAGFQREANHREAGLAMLETATLPPHPLFGRTLFATTDPILALRLQLQHLRESTTPLPLVATYHSTSARTAAVWESLHRESDVVFWSPDAELDGIIQARRANGMVTTLTANDVVERHLPRPATDWLQRARRDARPWSPLLRRHLRSCARSEVESTILSLELTNTQFVQFAAECDEELQRRLEGIRDHVGAVRRVRFCGREVCESDGMWVFADGQELVSNALLRIEQAITSRKNRTYYKGYIQFKDQRLPFLERADVLEKQGFEWLLAYVRDTCNAGVISYAPQWGRRMTGLAVLFHAPEQTRGVEQIGWDSISQRFQFPTFGITLTGEIDRTRSCLFDNEYVPARHVPLPAGRLSRHAVGLLSENHAEAQLVWATAAAVLANLLAPATNRQTHGVLFDGDGAQSIGSTAARLLGCPELVTDSRNLIANAQERLQPHTWPAVLTVPATKSLEPGRWLEAPEAANLLVSLPSLTVQILGLRQTWHVIRQARTLGSLQLTTTAIPALLSHYLQDLCCRRLHSPDGELVATIPQLLPDLAHWFEGQGGDPAVITQAGQLIEPADTTESWKFFVRLVAYAAGQGAITVGREPHAAQTDVLYLANNEHVWISQAAVSDAADRYGGLPLDVLLVTRFLTDAQALHSEVHRHGMLGWQLRRDWWDTKWKSLVHKEES